MPYKAIHNGETKPPQLVPESTTVRCTGCERPMHVVKSHERQTRSFVSRHFRHNREDGHGGGGGGGGGGSCGESDEHIRLKSIAASKLKHIFEDNCWKCELEYSIDRTISDAERRQADALLLFDDPDDQLGQGVAIEVQYKNESKDTRAVERDYLENNISTVWVTPDDFGEHDMRLNEADIRDRARRTVWPNHVPDRRTWWIPEHSPDHLRWENNGVDRFQIGRLDVISDRYSREVSVPATFGRPILDEHRYYTSDWSELFSDYAADHFRAQTAIPRTAASEKPTAKLPKTTGDKIKYESDGWEIHTTQRVTTDDPKFVFGAVLPPEYIQKQPMAAVEETPEPPKTPHDDVQCHNCGKYRYAITAPLLCENCGTPYNWRWNIDSGRISDDSVPESVSL